MIKTLEGKSRNLPDTGIKNFFTVSEKSESSQSSSTSNTVARVATSNSVPRAATSDARVGSSTDSTLHGTNLDKSSEPSFFYKFDVAHYQDMVKGMSHSEVNNLVQNVFKPDQKYAFPRQMAELLGMSG